MVPDSKLFKNRERFWVDRRVLKVSRTRLSCPSWMILVLSLLRDYSRRATLFRDVLRCA